jgi:hypothetical protein
MMEGPADASVDLQFSRSPTANRDKEKLRSQISFLSETPRSELEELAAWARQNGMRAEVGSYSDREFYPDAPEAFVDFVIDAMRPELADHGSPRTSPSAKSSHSRIWRRRSGSAMLRRGGRGWRPIAVPP